MIDPSKIRFVCSKGGGVRIAAYAGAAIYLDDIGVLKKVEGFAGTSAGAIFSTLAALGYSGYEIRDIILDYDFKKFEDKTLGSILTYPRDFGYCKGDYFLNVIQKHIKDKLGSKDATFYDLKKKGFKDLRVYSTELGSYQTCREFSFNESPHCPIAMAVRYSMSIPGIFKSLKYDGKYQIDGGMTCNFPIHAFDKISTPDEVLGLFLFNKEENEDFKPLKGWRPGKFIVQSFKASLKSQDINFFKDEEEVKRTIILNTLGISSTNFKITQEEKLRLIKSGYDCARVSF